MIEIKIKTEYITLDQFLKFVGISQTGGQAKRLILDGMVRVNGAIELKRGKKLRKNDIIEVNGKVYTIK